jgi:hypothetical protein
MAPEVGWDRNKESHFSCVYEEKQLNQKTSNSHESFQTVQNQVC